MPDRLDPASDAPAVSIRDAHRAAFIVAAGECRRAAQCHDDPTARRALEQMAQRFQRRASDA